MVSVASASSARGCGRGLARGSAALRRPLVLSDALLVVELAVIVVLARRLRSAERAHARVEQMLVDANRELVRFANRYSAVRSVLRRFELLGGGEGAELLGIDEQLQLRALLAAAVARQLRDPQPYRFAVVRRLAVEDGSNAKLDAAERGADRRRWLRESAVWSEPAPLNAEDLGRRVRFAATVLGDAVGALGRWAEDQS